MSDQSRAQNIAYVLESSSRAESMLRQLGSTGENMGELLANLPVELPRSLVNDLHQLRIQRNVVAHTTHKLSAADLTRAVDIVGRCLPALERHVRSVGLTSEAHGKAAKSKDARPPVKRSQLLKEAQAAAAQGSVTPEQRRLLEEERIRAEEFQTKTAQAATDIKTFPIQVRLTQWAGVAVLAFLAWQAWGGKLVGGAWFLLWDLGSVLLGLVAMLIATAGYPSGANTHREASDAGLTGFVVATTLSLLMFLGSKAPPALLATLICGFGILIYKDYKKKSFAQKQ